MRILTGADVPKNPDAGAAGTVYQTNAALQGLGHQVDEIWASDMQRRIRHGNLHYLLELPHGYLTAVAERCADIDYDVIQLSQPHAYLAAREHRRLKRRGIFVNRSHGLEPRVQQAVLDWRRRLNMPENRFPKSILSAIVRRLLARQWPAVIMFSDGIIVPCEDDKEYLVARLGAPPEKVRVIHHGTHPDFIDREVCPVTPDRAVRILHVCQFSFFKGPHILAAAISRVLASHREVSFTWVCSCVHHGEARSLIDPSVQDRVQMVDWMAQPHLLSMYDSHGVLILTSFAEGAAKVTLEAMSRGMCVVATDNSGMRDYIRHGQSGFLVPVGDVPGFADAIGRLLSNQPLCHKIAENARSTAVQYTWKRCAEKATAFYEELLSSKG